MSNAIIPRSLLLCLLIMSFASHTNAQSVAFTKVISPIEFEKQLLSSKNNLILDVRTPEEYNEGHILNAQNININDNDFLAHVQLLDTNKTVFVYCLAGGRSGNATKLLRKMGFDTIYDLKNGLAAWNGAGKKLVGQKTNAPEGLSKAQFEKLANHGDTMVLVQFSATWCGPCQKIHAYMPNIIQRFGDSLIILDIDYDKNKALASEMYIYNIPFIILMKNGKYILNIEGYLEEETLRNSIIKFNK